ncbi:MAG: hypothetical protein VKP62_04035, partial [Candidatus Sericytochromatia bacterium]|nr:hypothetical protein [Candidatus Sericytochromatia bacterium]
MAKPDFRPAFGAHPVPQLLDDLGEFAADIKGYFSGRFKLAPEDASGWLGSSEMAGDFALFGHDADGSQYGFWLYDGRTPANAPIVYLNVGHSGSTVLADSLEEFLSLLALDVTDLGMYYDEAKRPHKPSAGHTQFVTWLAECFGLAPAVHPERLVKRAVAAHPKLSAR